eukprot:205218_1
MLQKIVNKVRKNLERGIEIITVLFQLYFLSNKQVRDYLKSYELCRLDINKYDEMRKELGPNYRNLYKVHQANYYYVLNKMCALVGLKKMYSPPLMDITKSPSENQIIFEKQMINDLNIKSTDKVVDLGCGRGEIAKLVASETLAQVTGVNIDASQIENAKYLFKMDPKLQKLKSNFVLQDFNEKLVEFEDECFNYAYQIQCISVVNDKSKYLKEINRILKPNGKFAILCWVVDEGYDPKD